VSFELFYLWPFLLVAGLTVAILAGAFGSGFLPVGFAAGFAAGFPLGAALGGGAV
jgi:hypothetical protein